MKPKRAKGAMTPAAPLAEISGADRDLLTHAYKAGLILGWKHDRERGYRLTLGDRREEYVTMTNLSSHLAKLRNESSR